MKKTLFSCIALFTLGQAAMAQTLPADKLLRPEERSTAETSQKKAPAKADADATGYWVDAKSYYSDAGHFNPDEGAYYSFRANLTFNGSQVTMKDLVDLKGQELTNLNGVEGVYDASAKTITVSTVPYTEDTSYKDYTRYGDMSYYGDDCAVVLFSGDFTTTEQGTGLVTEEQLVFDVNDDLTVLTPRTGFGLWAFNKFNGSVVGCLDYYQGNTVTLEKMPDEAKLAFLPSSIHFEGANVTVGATLKQTVKLVNKGLKAANYSGYADGKGLQLAAYRSIDPETVQEVYAQLVPETAGDFSGKVVVTADNGATATLKVTAKVGEAPDFSKIVKEGDITFSIGSDFPFVVTDTITGFPVAVSTNKGSNSSSTLYANLVVPDGKVGVFGWKGIKEGSYGNGLVIQNNEEYVFDDTYSHGMDVTNFTDDVSNAIALPAGYYVIEFQNFTNMDWNDKGDVRLRTYLYDMTFRLYDAQDHLAVLKSDVLDFGEHFLDRLSVRDTLDATVLNLGTEPLQLTSIEGNGAFAGVMNNATADYCKELPVRIAYESDQLGEHAGTVTVNTNGGALTLNCKASNVAIPVDYHSIVSEGDFSFNTTAKYPFAVKNGKAYNSTSYVNSDDDLSSFLDAYFEVPEGKVGKLAWTAHNSSLDLFVFMKDTTLTTGTRITLDGVTSKEFAGENVDASSTEFEPEDLVFGAGRHVVRFFYMKKDSEPQYDDRLEVSNLSLTFTDGVEGITAAGREAIREEYYTLDGRRIQQPQHGITLVKTIFADGTSQTVKLMK